MGYSLKKKMMRAVPGVLVAAGLAVLLVACSSNSGEVVVGDALPEPDPPCTEEGYFKSNTPHYYYRCIKYPEGWRRFVFRCPGEQNYDPALRKCR